MFYLFDTKKKLLLCLAIVSVHNCTPFTIDRVILSANNNPEYIQFWPLVATFWKEIIGINPTLVLVANPNVFVDETLGNVLRFEPLPNMPESLQTQVLRLLVPALFPDEICIVSDIDMLPFSRDYFVDSVKDIPEDQFVVYRSKVYGGPPYSRFPMCYLAGKGHLFAEIFKLHEIKTIQDLHSTIITWKNLGFGWHTDEKVLFRYLIQWPRFKTNCTLLGHDNTGRIRRDVPWKYDEKKLKNNFYIEAHCIRPYKKYKNEIDKVIKIFLETNNRMDLWEKLQTALNEIQ